MHLSQELSTSIAGVLALVAGWVGRHLISGNTPAVPTPAPVPAKTPDPVPSGGSDPVAPIPTPSNVGNPILSLLWLVLINWLTKTKNTQSVAEQDPYTEAAAMSALSSAIKSDPERLAKMKSLLN